MDLSTWQTWRDIHAQPTIWESFGPQVTDMRKGMRAWIKDTKATEVWFSGAGSSGFIGDFVAAALGTTFDLPLKSVHSTDLVAAPDQFLGGPGLPLVVNFGRSGESAETVGVLNLLDALATNAPRLNITCNAKGTLALRGSANQQTVLLPPATHDMGFAMTASYTTMLLTALSIFGDTPPRSVFSKLAEHLRHRLPQYAALAKKMQTPTRIVITGSGALRYTAREGALKIMELTGGQIPVIWDSALGFRHGSKAFITYNTHVICLISADPKIARYDRDLAKELRAQFSDITVTEIDPTPLPDAWGSVVQVAAAQVIAVVLSNRLGFNVDDPFALYGTLKRVVKDVTLYPPASG